MKAFLFLLIFTALSYAQQQSVGVLPTIGSEDIDTEELDMLTKNLRTVAANILPGNAFIVLTQETVMRRLGGTGEYLKVCREGEGCIPSLGKKAEVDYVARCNVVSRGNILRMDCELYNSKTSALIGPFNSYDESPASVDELMAIMGRKAPDMFKKIPGATRIGPPSIVGGISGLESAVAGALDLEKNYLVNLATEPSGAALSFNGVPVANCPQSPCRVELPEGKVRIIAALEQYEIADTTVSFIRNNQSVNIKLKPNFGVFDVRPAYSDGLGRNEQWNLTINDKSVSSMENRLLPNKYKVKLSHRCYEDISFEVGINKGSREVFNMDKHINLKLGGVVLSTERDGEPSSEPVFVNGKQIGETPFSGSVAVCANLELGQERVSANIRLKHKETVRHVQKMPDSREWLAKMAEKRRRAQETAAEKRSREIADQRRQEYEAIIAEKEKWKMRSIMIGWRIMAGGTFTPGGSTSEWFDMTYTKYEEMDYTSLEVGGIFAFGFTLSLWPFDVMALVTELNYNFFTSNYCFGEDCSGNDDDKYFMLTTIYNNTIGVPILLRFGERLGYYIEIGYQWEFPFYSSTETRSGNLFTYGEFDTDSKSFSKHRLKMDQAIVVGFGKVWELDKLYFGARLIYNWTKLDRYGTLNGPIALGFIVAYDFY